MAIIRVEDDGPPTCPICERPFFFGNCAGCGYSVGDEFSEDGTPRDGQEVDDAECDAE